MKGKLLLIVVLFLFMFTVLSVWGDKYEYENTPFDISDNELSSVDSVLTLAHVLRLVADNNPLFKSYYYRLQAAESVIEQAGKWVNPEFEIEFEEVGWNAPGFREAEISVALSQDLELFGQRKARENYAEALFDDARLSVNQSVFELYLEIKNRYHTLVHAQQKTELCRSSVALAGEIVENIKSRMERGAALQSEFLLAEMEEQRALMELHEMEQEALVSRQNLASLWGGEVADMTVNNYNEPDFSLLYLCLKKTSEKLDSTKILLQMNSEKNILQAERELARADARPVVTFRGGVKRLEADNSKTFLFGIAMPLPFFDRNHGTQKSIEAQQLALEYEIDQTYNEIRSSIESHTIMLQQLNNKHMILDTLLLPKAKEVYRTLRASYNTGRISYIQLIEARRMLNDLSFEHNDIILEIQKQVLMLESETGVALRTDKGES